MKVSFKHFFKHSIIYGISNAAVKISGVVLLPIYTSVFSVEEYGRLGLFLITNLIFSQVLVFGQHQSLVRFSSIAEYADKKKKVFFTILVFIFFVLVIFISLSELFLNLYPSLLGDKFPYVGELKICIYIISLLVLNNFFLNKLRSSENSVAYTTINIVKLTCNISLIIYFVVSLNLKIIGVLYAQLISEFVGFLILVLKLINEMEFKFDKKILKNSLQFGVPLILSTLALNLLTGSDRYVIKLLAGEYHLGLYELGYRISGILNMMVIIPFSLTLLPSAYKVYGTDGAKAYYSKLMTYFAIGITWLGLILSFFGENILSLLAQNESFYDSNLIVPILIIAQIFVGINIVGSLGMYLTGDTKFVAIITLGCATVNILLNIIIVPKYGFYGAAFVTMISFVLLFSLSLIRSNKKINIPYEYFNLIKILFIGISAIFIMQYSSFQGILDVAIKIILSLLFPIMIWNIGILNKIEKEYLLKLYKQLRNLIKWN